MLDRIDTKFIFFPKTVLFTHRAQTNIQIYEIIQCKIPKLYSDIAGEDMRMQGGNLILNLCPVVFL
jgi:hypothetical protein